MPALPSQRSIEGQGQRGCLRLDFPAKSRPREGPPRFLRSREYRFQPRPSCCRGSREEAFAFPRLYWLSSARSRPKAEYAVISAVVDPSEVIPTVAVAIPWKIAVVASQLLHLLNRPIISAFASVLKCKLKPTTAADVSAFTSSLSAITAKTVNR